MLVLFRGTVYLEEWEKDWQVRQNGTTLIFTKRC